MILGLFLKGVVKKTQGRIMDYLKEVKFVCLRSPYVPVWLCLLWIFVVLWWVRLLHACPGPFYVSGSLTFWWNTLFCGTGDWKVQIVQAGIM